MGLEMAVGMGSRDWLAAAGHAPRTHDFLVFFITSYARFFIRIYIYTYIFTFSTSLAATTTTTITASSITMPDDDNLWTLWHCKPLCISECCQCDRGFQGGISPIIRTAGRKKSQKRITHTHTYTLGILSQSPQSCSCIWIIDCACAYLKSMRVRAVA